MAYWKAKVAKTVKLSKRSCLREDAELDKNTLGRYFLGRFHVSSIRKFLCTLATKNLVLQKSCVLLGQDTAESACVTKST